MQFQQFEQQAQIPADPSSGKKKLMALTFGVLGVAAIACIAIAFVNAGHQKLNDEQLSVLRSIDDADLELFDIHDSIIESFSVKKHTHKLLKNLRKILLKGLLSHEDTPAKRAANLILGFGFELLDSNDNKLVSQSEWKNFLNALFPEDTEKFPALFAEVNKGSDFNVAQFTAFIIKKVKQSKNDDNDDDNDIALKTDLKTSAITFARLIINDKQNYTKAYTVLFKIYDLDDSKILTKDEYIKAIRAFGSKEDKSIKQANKVFKFAQKQKFSDDGENIIFKNYSEYALSIQEELKTKLKDEKSKLPALEDDSRQKPSLRKVQQHKN